MNRVGAAGTSAGPIARQLGAVADRVLAAALVGEDIELVAARSGTTTVRAHNGDVESLAVADVAAVGVRVVSGGRQGFASAGTLDPDVIDELVIEARSNLLLTAPDDCVGLARPDGHTPADLDLWCEDVELTSTDDKVAMAIDMERRVVGGDPRISGVRTATYGDRSGTSIIATTTGIRALSRSTSAGVSAVALARDGEETRAGVGSHSSRDVAGIDIERAAAEAIERATALLGATKPDSTQLSVILEPRLAASLLGIVGSMLSGERALKGRTPFADRVGEPIAAPILTMIDDPTDPGSFGARRFDGEGLAARRNSLIVDGVLEGFLHHWTSAARAGTVSTASAVRGARSTPGVGWHALSVAPGSGTLDELIGQIEWGVVVASMAGLHSGVNQVSGDFSVGVEGHLVRAGQLAEPIREATLASTLPRLLSNIIAVGSEAEARPGGVTCPALVIADVALGGN